jgi:hypothetical protein
MEFNPDESPASLHFENEESPAFATARLWPRWLCDKCKLTVERGDVKCSALDIALQVYKVVERARKMIESGGYQSHLLTGMLFQSLKNSYPKGMDREFIFDVMEEMEEMADSSLSEADLLGMTW